jgi:hypothetical protein
MSSEIEIRLGCFFGIFAAVAICEILAPRRMPTTSKKSRWFSNLVLLSLNPVSVRLIFPSIAVDGRVVFQSGIPQHDELIAAIRERISGQRPDSFS